MSVQACKILVPALHHMLVLSLFLLSVNCFMRGSITEAKFRHDSHDVTLHGSLVQYLAGAHYSDSTVGLQKIFILL